MNATLGTSLVVLLALAVSSLPIAEEEKQKWYELEDSEFQTVLKQLKTLKSLESLNINDGMLSITFGRSPSTYVTSDDGTYLFDVYRRISPKGVTHVLLSPATGSPRAPLPPFQNPPIARFSAKEIESGINRSEAPPVFPSDKYYKGTPVYLLEALGKVRLRRTDVKKLMAHRDLA